MQQDLRSGQACERIWTVWRKEWTPGPSISCTDETVRAWTYAGSYLLESQNDRGLVERSICISVMDCVGIDGICKDRRIWLYNRNVATTDISSAPLSCAARLPLYGDVQVENVSSRKRNAQGYKFMCSYARHALMHGENDLVDLSERDMSKGKISTNTPLIRLFRLHFYDECKNDIVISPDHHEKSGS